LPKSKKFYVYFLRRPDKEDPFEPGMGQPFYIGKGSNGRVDQHRVEAKSLLHSSGRKLYKVSIIHFLWKQCLDFEESIEFENLTEQEAHEIESEAILAYGRRDLKTGILANLTNGGEGCSGRPCSDETKMRISQAQAGEKSIHWGKTLSEEHRRKVGEAGRGRFVPQEQRDRKSQTLMGHLVSDETRGRMSKANKGRKPWNTGKHLPEELRKRISDKLKGRKLSEAVCKQMSEVRKGIPRPYLIGKTHSEETKQKMREAQTKRRLQEKEAKS